MEHLGVQVPKVLACLDLDPTLRALGIPIPHRLAKSRVDTLFARPLDTIRLQCFSLISVGSSSGGGGGLP